MGILLSPSAGTGKEQVFHASANAFHDWFSMLGSAAHVSSTALHQMLLGPPSLRQQSPAISACTSGTCSPALAGIPVQRAMDSPDERSCERGLHHTKLHARREQHLQSRRREAQHVVPAEQTKVWLNGVKHANRTLIELNSQVDLWLRAAPEQISITGK